MLYPPIPFSYDAHLALGFYIYKGEKKEYFEYDACRTRCLNQIYEDTNLHLLSVWRGFPYRNKRLGFPKPTLEVCREKLYVWIERIILKHDLRA